MQREFSWKQQRSGAATPLRKSALSPPRLQLVRLMQTLRYGRIRNLRVCNQEPDFAGHLDIVETVKMNGRNGAHPLLDAVDYALKREVIDLFARLDELQEGLIEKLEVKDGIPFSMEIRRTVHLPAPHVPADEFGKKPENLSQNSVNTRAFPVGKQ